MTARFLRIPASLLVLTMAISLGAGLSRAGLPPSAAAQDKDKDKNKDKDKSNKLNKAEVTAYNAFVAAQTGDPATQVQLGEDFIAKYPQSQYVKGVYAALTATYYSSGNIDKMNAAGAKALEMDPDNVDVLSLLAMVISRRAHATTPEGTQQVKNAEAYAHHAIELIPAMVKPATVDDATFEKAKNDKLSLSHSALGLINFNNKKYEDARTELNLAVQLASTPDPVDYYLLGSADSQASYYHDAVAAYQKCSDSGPMVARCKALMATAQHDADTKLGR
jgi:tetratricopeptide (TPR) repeat protein